MGGKGREWVQKDFPPVIKYFLNSFYHRINDIVLLFNPWDLFLLFFFFFKKTRKILNFRQVATLDWTHDLVKHLYQDHAPLFITFFYFYNEIFHHVLPQALKFQNQTSFVTSLTSPQNPTPTETIIPPFYLPSPNPTG